MEQGEFSECGGERKSKDMAHECVPAYGTTNIKLLKQSRMLPFIQRKEMNCSLLYPSGLWWISPAIASVFIVRQMRAKRLLAITVIVVDEIRTGGEDCGRVLGACNHGGTFLHFFVNKKLYDEMVIDTERNGIGSAVESFIENIWHEVGHLYGAESDWPTQEQIDSVVKQLQSMIEDNDG